jgi:hypothetical protein
MKKTKYKKPKKRNYVANLFEKQIEQVRRSVESCLTPEELANSKWVVYGENEVLPTHRTSA